MRRRRKAAHRSAAALEERLAHFSVLARRLPLRSRGGSFQLGAQHGHLLVRRLALPACERLRLGLGALLDRALELVDDARVLFRLPHELALQRRELRPGLLELAARVGQLKLRHRLRTLLRRRELRRRCALPGTRRCGRSDRRVRSRTARRRRPALRLGRGLATRTGGSRRSGVKRRIDLTFGGRVNPADRTRCGGDSHQRARRRGSHRRVVHARERAPCRATGRVAFGLRLGGPTIPRRTKFGPFHC